MDKISLKIKFLIPLVIVISLLIVFLNILYSFLKEKEAFRISSDEVASFCFMQKHILNDQVKSASWFIEEITKCKNIQRAYIAEDTNRLKALSKEKLTDFNQKFSIGQILYIGIDGKTIAAVPDSGPENLRKTNFSLDEMKDDDKSSIYKIELTPERKINFQYIAPWYIDGKLSGYIELCSDCCKLISALGDALNAEIVIATQKDYYFAKNGKNSLAGSNCRKYLELEHSEFVLLNDLPFPATDEFTQQFNKAIKKLSGRHMSLFSFVKGDNEYRCTLLKFHFSDKLNLPVLLINLNEDYAADCFLSKLIFYGSIILGLVIFFLFLRITGKVEKELKEREAELSETNAELESFAYIASHDLKAPLRAIDNLATWIEDDMEDINENTKQQLDLMKGRISRMNQLLDSLLEYSRIGRVKAEKFEIDVEKIVEKIIYSLSMPKGFNVEIDKNMPTFETFLAPLNQVFLNLIVNAVKHNNRPDGEIKITCGQTGNFYEFSVIDNGPGISKDNYEKIFNLFTTLKSKDEVEGVGMGLAIIKKTVEKYGGEIKVESELGKGTSFAFTWPKK